MNKNQFVFELRKALYGMPPQEIESSVQFYSEMIDDRMEEGMSEEEAVASLGSINDIAGQIRGGTYPFSHPMNTVNQKPPKHKLTGLEIVLLVITFPLWFSLLAALVSIYIALWCVILSLYITAVCFGIAGAGCIVGAIISVTGAASILCALGVGFILAGLAVFLIVGLNYLSMLYVRLTAWIGKSIASVF